MSSHTTGRVRVFPALIQVRPQNHTSGPQTWGRVAALSSWPPDLGKGSGIIFPNPATGQALSANTLEDRLQKEAIDAVPHGFRSSFRDWAAELSGASWEAIELSLAHQIGTSTSQAYFRSGLVEMRRPLMEAWGDFALPGEKAPF